MKKVSKSSISSSTSPVLRQPQQYPLPSTRSKFYFSFFSKPSFLIIMLLSSLITACFKEDKIAPTIQLKGLPIITVLLGNEYIEPGVIAEDDRDGDISYLVKATGTPNIELAGQYFIRYNVNDASGNHAAEASRTVFVAHNNENLEGIYEVNETCDSAGTVTYFITITPGSGKDVLHLKNFNNFPGNIITLANLSGNTRQILTLTEVIMGDTLYSGSGAIDSTGTKIQIDFTKTYNSTVDSCSLILNR